MNNSQNSIENAVTSQSVAEFVNANNITQINPTVAVSAENKYPFVTFIDADNKAHNLYFSKGLAPQYPQGTPISKGFFADINVVSYMKDGEPRMNLSKKGGNRLEISNIL